MSITISVLRVPNEHEIKIVLKNANGASDYFYLLWVQYFHNCLIYVQKLDFFCL